MITSVSPSSVTACLYLVIQWLHILSLALLIKKWFLIVL